MFFLRLASFLKGRDTITGTKRDHLCLFLTSMSEIRTAEVYLCFFAGDALEGLEWEAV